MVTRTFHARWALVVQQQLLSLHALNRLPLDITVRQDRLDLHRVLQGNTKAEQKLKIAITNSDTTFSQILLSERICADTVQHHSRRLMPKVETSHIRQVFALCYLSWAWKQIDHWTT